MGHGKETPRQKMIGMMYLVLTALLALNVQKEVLNAFIIVDEGMTKTTKTFEEKNTQSYQALFAAAEKKGPKGAQMAEIVKQVKAKADDIFKTIQDLKILIVKKADGDETEGVKGNEVHVEHVNSKDNMDIAAQVMVGAEGNGEGKKLRKKIEDFRKYLVENIDDKQNYKPYEEQVKKILNTDDPEVKDGNRESWEQEHFEHLPLAGVVTIMSGLQANIRNAESEMLKYCFVRLEANSTVFNKLEAAIIPNSNYVMAGNDYVAKIFIAASDSNQRAKVMIGAYDQITKPDGEIDYKMKGAFDSVSKYEAGKAIYQVRAGAVGAKKVQGLIEIGSGEDAKHVPFELNYTVGEPAVIVSPSKMNVFYIGVENPVEVSIPGVGGDKIFPSIDNGTITRAKGGYIVQVTKQGKANVTVMADVGTGQKKNMGSRPFRVKPVPDPVAKVAGIKGGGPIAKGVLMAQTSITAELENFDFDLVFNVKSFRVSAVINGFERDARVQGKKFTDPVYALIKSVGKGQKVYFDEIIAVGPDKTDRKLGSIILNINSN